MKTFKTGYNQSDLWMYGQYHQQKYYSEWSREEKTQQISQYDSRTCESENITKEEERNFSIRMRCSLSPLTCIHPWKFGGSPLKDITGG